MPGFINLRYGWGHHLPDAKLSLAAQHPAVNLNFRLDENARDPLAGNRVMSDISVRISAMQL